MASHFAINFLPITGRGWLDGADSFAPFSILQITFFGGKFLRNRMWIGLRWDRMSDCGKKVCNASKNKDTFGKQPNLNRHFEDRKFWQWFVYICHLSISFDLMTCFCNINLPLLSPPLWLGEVGELQRRKWTTSNISPKGWLSTVLSAF